MLVLSRKTTEVVVIRVPPSTVEQVIEVCVVEIRYHNSKVRLGFEADKSVTIHREEVEVKIAAKEEANRLAGEGELPDDEIESPAKPRPPVEDSLEYKREYLHGRLEIAPGIDVS